MFWYFTRTHFFHEGSIHLSYKSNFFTYHTCNWGTTLSPYLSFFVLIFVMRYPIVLMFLWFPIGPLLCGSTIESPLFRASELSHHQLWSLSRVPLYPTIVIHPSLLGPSLVLHIIAFSTILPYSSWYCVSRCQSIHALYALIREVVYPLLGIPHFIIIISVRLFVAPLFSLVP